ncbi:HAMP domain-containing methyl-accepting chemotaxis protein [Pigmentibacter ruber]|nr:hypothetical protein GTC16762_00970 [Pigmentibacter ruber]
MGKKSLAFKIITSVSMLIFLILFACLYCMFMIKKTQEYASETGLSWMPSIAAFSDLNVTVGSLSRRVVLVIADSIAGQRDKYVANIEDINKFKTEVDKAFNDYKALLSPGEEKLYEDTLTTYKEYLASLNQELDLVKERRGLEALNHYYKVGRPALFKFLETLGKEEKFNIKGGKDSTTKGESLTSITIITMSIVLVISVLISITIIISIVNLSKDIQKALVSLKNQGNGTMEIANTLMNNSKVLTESVSAQAASVHQTTAAINQITSMVNKTSENAQQSAEVAKEASKKAENNMSTMKKLMTSMDTIQESNNQLQNIAQIINQIHAKTSVINDIVSKTELLSLNASIESARAGEYGKGFAVVAEEVGNLAKVSGKSAKEIQDLIVKSQEEVNKILSVTTGRISDGKQVTTEVQESFVKISEDIVNMVTVIEQISSATKEQEIGVRQITTAMTEIDRTTQRNQTSATETSNTANKMVEQGEMLLQTTKEIQGYIMGQA